MCNLTELKIGERSICVADIKKSCIENIISSIHLCSAIDKVVLFGSATQTDCTDSSDVDIAIFGKKSKTKMFSSKGYRNFVNSVVSFSYLQDYDLLYFDSTKKNKSVILEDINNGVVLFER